MQHSVRYTILFAALVCVVCAILVSTAAVSLSDLQDANATLDKRKNMLSAAGLIEAGQPVSAQQVEEIFKNIKTVAVDLESGKENTDIDPANYDQQKAQKDPEMSREIPPNPSVIKRLPTYAVVYHVLDDQGQVKMIVLPIEGYGLWGTLYGFLALDADTKTIRGLTYYQHKETPGLGGEVDNPSWKALWPGRVAFDENWEPAIKVIKGKVGPPSEAPHQVDGLSGATITSRGVTNMLDFWLGENGFGPYLENFRKSR
ncbi:MAG: Na(+)-translocating NADH-quinone reductase subunit C [Acidobacteria bacterium]|nr:Na(+)-translocating NADH-quinone reductase subunit C [Acidobacteriota bacterium]